MLAVGAWIAVGYLSVAGIETPAYEVVEEREGYEIRLYRPHIVAEVTVEDEYRDAMNSGFRKLADFIFGNNTAPGAEGSAKIAMTAPVQEREVKSAKIAMTAPVQERDEEGGRVVAFVMPSEYTMETLPTPNNPEVRIVEVPEKRYAVHSFSGRVPEDRMREKKEAISAMALRDGLKPVGEPILSQYDPPWTPPFMRKNEVWLEIE